MNVRVRGLGPFQLWDAHAQTIRHPVVVLVDGRQVTDPSTPLEDDQEVIVLKVAAGG